MEADAALRMQEVAVSCCITTLSVYSFSFIQHTGQNVVSFCVYFCWFVSLKVTTLLLGESRKNSSRERLAVVANTVKRLYPECMHFKTILQIFDDLGSILVKRALKGPFARVLQIRIPTS